MYDMAFAWILFAIVWWFMKRPRREAMAALLFAAYYGSCRLLEDFLRIDKRFGPLTGSQWTALTVVVLCIGLAIWFAVTRRPGPTTPPRSKIWRRRSEPEPEPAPEAQPEPT
jgi:prolipoprotein diacylglyceryltransferase